MPNLPTRVLLFLSSYTPLFFIFFVRSYSQNKWFAYCSIGIGAVSLIALAVYLRVARQMQTLPVTVEEVVSRDGDAMSYIVTYLIPFLQFNTGAVQDAISLVAVFAVVGLLYVNSNLIHTNPMLNLAGFHIYEIKTAEGITCALLTRRNFVRLPSELNAIPLGDYILLEG